MPDSDLDNPFNPVTETSLHEAWGWLEDCALVDEDDAEKVHSGEWSAAIIIEMVDRAYDGGWPEFSRSLTPIEKWLLVHERRDSRGVLIGVTEKSNLGHTRYRSLT